MPSLPRQALAFLSVGLVACGPSDNLKKQLAQRTAAADSLTNALSKLDTTSMFKPSKHKYGPPTGRLRVANLMEINGQPIGPVDVYEMRQPDSTDAPIIKGLSYGQISDYVSPRAEGPYQGSTSQMYVFPAGQKTAAMPFGTNIDNIGFHPDDQITIAMGPSHLGNGPSMALRDLVESGSRLNKSVGDTMYTVPAGQAILVVRLANMSADSLPELYLLIDGACFRPDAHSSLGPMEGVSWPVTPGSHTLGVVTSPRGYGLLTCAGKKPGAITTVATSAGARYAVFIYGENSDGFKVMTAPISLP